MKGLDELLDLVMDRSAEVAALPAHHRELVLLSIWAANEDAALQAGLSSTAAQHLADSLDEWIRAALLLRTRTAQPMLVH